MIRMPSRKKFMSYVKKKKSGCWIYTHYVKKSGYGRWTAYDKEGTRFYLYAHRVSYEIFVSPIPKGKTIHHRCFVRRCVNPNHLVVRSNSWNSSHRIKPLILGECKHHRPVVVYCHPCLKTRIA